MIFFEVHILYTPPEVLTASLPLKNAGIFFQEDDPGFLLGFPPVPGASGANFAGKNFGTEGYNGGEEQKKILANLG